MLLLYFAAMAELADALDLGSSEATRTGSIPASRTNIMKIPLFLDITECKKGVCFVIIFAQLI